MLDTLRPQIYPDANGQWRWRYVNGSRITGSSGESFDSKAKALRAINGFHKAISHYLPSRVYEMKTADVKLAKNVITIHYP